LLIVDRAQNPTTSSLPLRSHRHIHHLPHLPLPAMRRHHHRSQARIVEGDCCCGRAVQQMQRHAVAPDGGAARHYYERAAGDGWQGRQGLGGGDGGGDGDGIDDMGAVHFIATLRISNPSATLSANLGLFRKYSSAISLSFQPGMILHS